MIENMDLDIGTLIYIIVTIVAVLAGVLGKKKKPVPGIPGEEAPRKGFFDKLEAQIESFSEQAKSSMGVVSEEYVNENAEVAEEQAEVIDERDYFEKFSDDYDSGRFIEDNSLLTKYEGVYSPDDKQNDILMEMEGLSSTDAMEIIQLEEEIGDEYDKEKLVEEFDLRNAVIYSIIINRIEI